MSRSNENVPDQRPRRRTPGWPRRRAADAPPAATDRAESAAGSEDAPAPGQGGTNDPAAESSRPRGRRGWRPRVQTTQRADATRTTGSGQSDHGDERDTQPTQPQGQEAEPSPEDGATETAANPEAGTGPEPAVVPDTAAGQDGTDDPAAESSRPRGRRSWRSRPRATPQTDAAPADDGEDAGDAVDAGAVGGVRVEDAVDAVDAADAASAGGVPADDDTDAVDAGDSADAGAAGGVPADDDVDAGDAGDSADAGAAGGVRVEDAADAADAGDSADAGAAGGVPADDGEDAGDAGDSADAGAAGAGRSRRGGSWPWARARRRGDGEDPGRPGGRGRSWARVAGTPWRGLKAAVRPARESTSRRERVRASGAGAEDTPGRQAAPDAGDTRQERPSWRRAAREASDVRAMGNALNRLARLAPELLFGPEPTPTPSSGAGPRWLRVVREHRAVILWVIVFVMFAINVQYLSDNSWLGDPAVEERVAQTMGLVGSLRPAVSGMFAAFQFLLAFLMVLPLGLAAHTPMRAWRLLILLAVPMPLVIPPSSDQGPPWPVVMIFVAFYVVYVLAVRTHLPKLIGVWLVTSAMILWSYLIAGHRENALGESNASIVFFTILLALGYLVGTRRRLQREVVAGEQRTQEEQERRALLEERARIARELHDVVAHHMSVIAVRAETAPFRIPDLSQAGKDDMAETSAVARQALTEMRRLLGVLRGADTGGERAPQPRLDRLDQLVAGVRNAGLNVDTHVYGTARPLPEGVELSAYRIVQEALSNVLRHAPGAHTRVVVTYDPDVLRLRIENQPSPGHRDDPAPAAGRGHGIIGMRERATMLGGQLEVGPTAAGGYVVEAVLPLDGRQPGDHEPEEPPPS